MGTRPIDDIITGERLQEIADVSVGTARKFVSHISLPEYVRRRICPIRWEGDSLEIPDEALARLRLSRVVFVYADFAELFLSTLAPAMEVPFVLITHNGAREIGRGFEPYLAQPRLTRWYAQNVASDFVHPKMVCLPLGIANAQWEHGNLEAFRGVAEENAGRDIAVYANFELSTAAEPRGRVSRELASNPLVTNAGRAPVIDYWRALRRSRFVAAPRGRGIDTHRLWEALYLGAVPIVDDEATLGCHEGLPVMRTGDWAGLNATTLDRFLADLPPDAFASERLTLGWWRRRIRAEIEAA